MCILPLTQFGNVTVKRENPYFQKKKSDKFTKEVSINAQDFLLI